MAAFRLISPAFPNDGQIPIQYTQDADDLSPPLAWEGVPDGTKELVLIVEDTDADEGVFTHWLVYALLPEDGQLPEGLPRDVLVNEPVELCQGLNEFDESGYTGPTPEDDRGPTASSSASTRWTPSWTSRPERRAPSCARRPRAT